MYKRSEHDFDLECFAAVLGLAAEDIDLATVAQDFEAKRVLVSDVFNLLSVVEL